MKVHSVLTCRQHVPQEHTIKRQHVNGTHSCHFTNLHKFLKKSPELWDSVVQSHVMCASTGTWIYQEKLQWETMKGSSPRVFVKTGVNCFAMSMCNDIGKRVQKNRRMLTSQLHCRLAEQQIKTVKTKTTREGVTSWTAGRTLHQCVFVWRKIKGRWNVITFLKHLYHNACWNI